MIDRGGLVRALSARRVADWAVIEREQELAVAGDAAPGLRRAERRTRCQLTVYDDSTGGRGIAHVTIDATDGNPAAIVDRAIAIARAAAGPAWASTPPAAPANVQLADLLLAGGDLLEAAGAALRAVRRPAGAEVATTLTLLREHVTATGRQGLHASWVATLLRAETLVASGGRSLAVGRAARRMMDLDLDRALAAGAAELALLAGARAPAPGPCAVVLDAEALLHGEPGGLGVWAAFASQADAAVAREGLTRYREGMPVADGAARLAEPLTIESDGALPYAVRSAPLGDHGDAVRRFSLVERGVAAGLGLTPHEAALRHRDPNGGVRNLVVASGTWTGALPAGRTVEVRRLRDLWIDPYTGEASLEIALGIDHPAGTPFTGGTLRLDLIAALAHARRSAARIRRGAYEGPSSVLVERAELIA